MTSDQERCSLGSFLPTSCRGRAEAFARRLHSRLTSLGSEDGNGSVDETSWLASGDNTVTFSQPTLTSDVALEEDPFLDFDSIESPGSPQELEGKLFETIINKNNFEMIPNSNCCCLSQINVTNFDDISSEIKCPACNSQHSENYSDFHRPSNEKKETYDSNNDDQSQKINNTSKNLPNKENLNVDENSTSDSSDLESNKSSSCPTLEVSEPMTLENEESPEEQGPVRRCSSLKTGKTPPGTPGTKKIVRFADVMGLDLADVRTYLDDIPKIPNSAYNDLKVKDYTDLEPEQSLYVHQNNCNSNVNRYLAPLFQQPCGLLEFLDRLRDNNVCLDSAFVKDPVTLEISGIVSVRNLDFHKSVHVRYTLDSWHSFADVRATYLENSCDGYSDKFSFTIFANNLSIGERLQFAIRFQCKGCQYWDNNFGLNYIFQCMSSTNTMSSNIVYAGELSRGDLY